MKRTISTLVALLVCLIGGPMAMGLDSQSAAGSANCPAALSSLFAVEHGGDELAMILLQFGSIMLGLFLLFLAFCTVKTARRSQSQNGLSRSTKRIALTFILLGSGVMAGGIVYGAMRMIQIAEEHRRD